MATTPRQAAIFLNALLRTRQIKDDSKNGLQHDAKRPVERIAFAVDACAASFQKARAEGADLIVVHHGLLWKKEKTTPLLRRRISFLLKNKISLYACHLPLDAHPVLGNNAVMCAALGVSNRKKFGDYHGVFCGFSGEISATTVQDLARQVQGVVGPSSNPKIFQFNNRKIRRIGIVSGGASFVLEEAGRKKLDCVVIGEFKHGAFHDAEELGISVIEAGHYWTETLGVKALMPVLEKKLGVKTVFVESPTGL